MRPECLQMTMHDGATGNPEHPGQPSGPSQSVSAAPAEILQEVAMLQLAPQADGMITTVVRVAHELDLHYQ